jgi:hypothetical protein
MSRRDVLKLAGVALAVAGMSKYLGWWGDSNDTGVKGKVREGLGIFGEPLPYLPEVTRINPEVPLPEDVIDSENLWRYFHTRTWSGEDTKLFLRPGIKDLSIFQDLRNGVAKSLDIIMFDDSCLLSDEQRQNLDPELVRAFDEELKYKGFGSGLFLTSGNGAYGIFCRKYSTDEPTPSSHLLESYPEVDGGWVATYNTPGITVRHEMFHYDYPQFSDQSTEEMVGMDIEESIRVASENKQYFGNDSGYFIVYELREGVVIS